MCGDRQSELEQDSLCGALLKKRVSQAVGFSPCLIVNCGYRGNTGGFALYTFV